MEVMGGFAAAAAAAAPVAAVPDSSALHRLRRSQVAFGRWVVR